MEKATLAGGCFWCMEAVYQKLKGVTNVVSGYAGGSESDAHYDIVKKGTTKHAEVIQITYDDEVISFEKLLEVFWTVHDPTTLNRQGNDIGPQYRSAIFYHNNNQKEIAQYSIKSIASELYNNPIVTTLEPMEAFYQAEQYHHDYYNRIGNQNPYCTFVISPKVNKFRKKFADLVK